MVEHDCLFFSVFVMRAGSCARKTHTGHRTNTNTVTRADAPEKKKTEFLKQVLEWMTQSDLVAVEVGELHNTLDAGTVAALGAEVNQNEMVVGTARHERVPESHHLIGERLGVLEHLFKGLGFRVRNLCTCVVP